MKESKNEKFSTALRISKILGLAVMMTALVALAINNYQSQQRIKSLMSGSKPDISVLNLPKETTIGSPLLFNKSGAMLGMSVEIADAENSEKSLKLFTKIFNHLVQKEGWETYSLFSRIKRMLAPDSKLICHITVEDLKTKISCRVSLADNKFARGEFSSSLPDEKYLGELTRVLDETMAKAREVAEVILNPKR